MRDLVRLIVWMVADLFRSRTALEGEIWMRREPINVLRRTRSQETNLQRHRPLDRRKAGGRSSATTLTGSLRWYIRRADNLVSPAHPSLHAAAPQQAGGRHQKLRQSEVYAKTA